MGGERTHSTSGVDRHQIPVEPSEDDFASISYYELSQLKSPEEVSDTVAATLALSIGLLTGEVKRRAVQAIRVVTEAEDLKEKFPSIGEQFPRADFELVQQNLKTYLKTLEE